MECALLIISILIAILAKCADPKLNQNKIRITDDRSLRQQGNFVDSSNNHINMSISNRNNYPYLKSYSSSFISKSSKLINTENTLYLNKAKTEENFDTIVVIELSILTISGVGLLFLIVIAIQNLAYLRSKKSTTFRIENTSKLSMVPQSTIASFDFSCSRSNSILNPNRTMMFLYIMNHITEFENIAHSKEWTKSEKSMEIRKLMIEKITYFIDNAGRAFGQLFDEHKSILNPIKDSLRVGNVEGNICLMWKHESLGLYSLCNAAILTDLHYAVFKKEVQPIFYKDVNFNKDYTNLRERLEVVAYYCSCLCYLILSYGRQNQKTTLYRGVGFEPTTQCVIGDSYRFTTFQSCSTRIDTAKGYMEKGYCKSLYTIRLPPNCINSLSFGQIVRDTKYSINPDEFLIAPYACFTLDNINNSFEILDEEEDGNSRDETQFYEMTLSTIPFYNDIDLPQYFPNVFSK